MKNLFVGLIGLQQLVQNNTYRDEVKKEYDAIRMQNLPKMIRYLGVSNLIKLEKLKK